MINNLPSRDPIKIPSEKVMIYEALEGHSYSHHQFIAEFGGKLFAMWSNGRENEDDIGQRIMISTSNDFYHWSEPKELCSPDSLGRPKEVFTAGGFYNDGEKLYAFAGSYSYTDGYPSPHKIPGTYCMVFSTSDGENWEGPERFKYNVIPNQPPKKTHTGRLIIAGNIMFPYSDSERGVDDYKYSSIIGDALGENIFDDSYAIHLVTERNGWNLEKDGKPGANLICEASFFETDDNVIHMMLRSNTFNLWVSESFDNGESWSEPHETGYTDDKSKFYFDRLPDGRFFGISNTVPKGHRCPLVLCVSKDGENFDKHFILRDENFEKKYEGVHKGGKYGYPSALVKDGYMYIIYSKYKESVEVTRIKLDDIIYE